MCHRDGIVGADLQQQVGTAPTGSSRSTVMTGSDRAEGGLSRPRPTRSNTAGPKPTVTVSLAGRNASSGSVSARAGIP